MSKEAELLAEIDARAQRAKDADRSLDYITREARDLHEKFPHRSVEDIEERIKDAWRNYGMVWKTSGLKDRD
jgi:hypothetical protein